MSFFRVQSEGARAAVSEARTEWSELQGIETVLTEAMSSAGVASHESKIIVALYSANYDFLRPLTVTMVKAGNQAFDGADQVINVLENASSDQASEAMRAIQSAKGLTTKIGILPTYEHKAPTIITATPR